MVTTSPLNPVIIIRLLINRTLPRIIHRQYQAPIITNHRVDLIAAVENPLSAPLAARTSINITQTTAATSSHRSAVTMTCNVTLVIPLSDDAIRPHEPIPWPYALRT